MSINYYPQNPPRLRSPILEGILQERTGGKDKRKSKKTFFNPKTDDKETVDETLDKTLFNKCEKTFKKASIIQKSALNLKSITSLETIFKIAAAFVTAVGGTFCLLELINIIRLCQSGSYSFGNNLLLLVIAFITTIIADVICIGFINLTKAIRCIYRYLENQSLKQEV